MSVPIKGNREFTFPIGKHVQLPSFVSHSRAKSRASQMADLATKKIKIVSEGCILANPPRARANLMFLPPVERCRTRLVRRDLPNRRRVPHNRERSSLDDYEKARFSFCVPLCLAFSPVVVQKLNSVVTGKYFIPLSVPRDNAATAGPLKLNGTALPPFSPSKLLCPIFFGSPWVRESIDLNMGLQCSPSIRESYKHPDPDVWYAFPTSRLNMDPTLSLSQIIYRPCKLSSPR